MMNLCVGTNKIIKYKKVIILQITHSQYYKVKDVFAYLLKLIEGFLFAFKWK